MNLVSSILIKKLIALAKYIKATSGSGFLEWCFRELKELCLVILECDNCWEEKKYISGWMSLRRFLHWWCSGINVLVGRGWVGWCFFPFHWLRGQHRGVELWENQSKGKWRVGSISGRMVGSLQTWRRRWWAQMQLELWMLWEFTNNSGHGKENLGAFWLLQVSEQRAGKTESKGAFSYKWIKWPPRACCVCSEQCQEDLPFPFCTLHAEEIIFLPENYRIP